MFRNHKPFFRNCKPKSYVIFEMGQIKRSLLGVEELEGAWELSMRGTNSLIFWAENVNSLLEVIKIEVFDSQRNFGSASLNVYNFGIQSMKKILVSLSIDDMDTGGTLTI